MNSLGQNPDDDSLDEAAAEWLYEREVGMTPEKERAYHDWLSKNPRHGEAMQRVERTLELLDELPQVSGALTESLPASIRKDPTAAQKVYRLQLHWLGWGGAAAALIAVIFFASWRGKPVDLESITFAADYAAQRTLVLPDGSVMDLNVGSEVSVQFGPDARHLRLHKGQAHFQVAHDTARPFIVTAGETTVRAVGTAFDVRLERDSVNIVVVEGRVELGNSLKKTPSRDPVSKPLLEAGEYAEVSQIDTNLRPAIKKADPATMHELISWQNSMASFMSVPLREVIARFNLRNQTQLILNDADLGRRKIGGTVALDDVDAFVRLLEQDGDIAADRSVEGKIELRSAH